MNFYFFMNIALNFYVLEKQPNQATEAEDSCKYEISIPIAKISLKCNLNKTHAQKLLHLLVFEKVIKKNGLTQEKGEGERKS